MDAPTIAEAVALLDAHPEHERARPHLRDWAASDDPIKRASVRARLALPAALAPPPPSAAPAGARPLPEVLAELARIKACPYWSRPGCGCRQGLCSFPWRRRLVSFDDCRACLAGNPREIPGGAKVGAHAAV